MTVSRIQRLKRTNSLATRKKFAKQLECAGKRRTDRPVHTKCFHSGGATTMIFIVTEAKSVSSFVMCPPVPLQMFVHNHSSLTILLLHQNTQLFVDFDQPIAQRERERETRINPFISSSLFLYSSMSFSSQTWPKIRHFCSPQCTNLLGTFIITVVEKIMSRGARFQGFCDFLAQHPCQTDLQTCLIWM